MKCIGFENDREKVPLMKALHAVALEHKCVFVVVAYQPKEPKATRTRTLLIDCKDNTQPEETYAFFMDAGTVLIQSTGAIANFIHEKREREEEAPAENDGEICGAIHGVLNCTRSPDHEGDHIAHGGEVQVLKRWPR